jgi:hypothetical protein
VDLNNRFAAAKRKSPDDCEAIFKVDKKVKECSMEEQQHLCAYTSGDRFMRLFYSIPSNIFTFI